MQYRIFIAILFFTGLLSAVSFGSLLVYFDPMQNITLGLSLLLISYLLMFNGCASVILYFIKKIYFRGTTGYYYIYTSLRQSFLLSLLPIWYILLVYYGIPIGLPFLLFVLILFLVEKFIGKS